MDEELQESLLRMFLALVLLGIALLVFGCKEPGTVQCCQHYNGKTSGWILTTEGRYEEDVLHIWGADMEGQMDYDSARVMFIHCKEL